ncbi:hypothetical protein ZOSMA_142G00010 [Zostera marina]|uniref:RRM domain-containing protein n=1 Tax=Zostera marina TaxID=29655 RepID=A0A0K9PZP5_ZOSMR|nr:hypothetical protein ZOSMA_142G00010 [Zostera marina]
MFLKQCNSQDAANAVHSLNGKKFDDKIWYFDKALKKSEREQELKAKYEQNINKNHGLILFLKNLDDTVDDDKKELFLILNIVELFFFCCFFNR